MRICLLSYRGNPYCGGQGVYIYYLSRALHSLGHEVHVISGAPYPDVAEGVVLHPLEGLNLYDTDDSLIKAITRVRNAIDFYEFADVCLGSFPEPFTFSMRAYNKIRQLRKDIKFDIIHDNQGLGYGLLLMKRLGIPVIATIHHPIPIDRDMEIAHTRGFREKFRLRRWYSFCFMQGIVARRIERIITVSNSSAGAIERSLKVKQDRLRVIYLGIDQDLFKHDDGVIKQPNSIILVNSSEHSVKGVAHLLKALHLLKNGNNFRLTVIGSPSPDGNNMRLVEEYGLQDKISFTGRTTMDELVRYYVSSEICVVPSLYEGFGLPAAEAMSCRLPVVSTSGGALPEVVGPDGETGIIVPPADPDAIASAIKFLLDDQDLRQKMGVAGRKRIEENFNWEQAAMRTVEVYQEVL